MDFEQTMPIYLQIVILIKKRIIQGKLKPEDKIPSVRELAEELKVNPNTISRAYQQLEQENITETKRGMGTFISGDTLIMEKIKTEQSNSIITRFIKDMTDAGFSQSETLTLLTQNLKSKEEK